AAFGSPKFQRYLVHNFMVVALIPLLFLSVIHERAYTEKNRTESASRLEEAARAIGQNIDDYLNNHRRAVTTLANRLSTIPLTESDVMPILQHEHAIYDGVNGFVAIGLTGQVIAWEPRILQPNLQDRDYFQKVLATRQTYISTPRAVRIGPNSLNDVPIVVISTPIFRPDGNMRAILASALNLEKFKIFGRDYGTIPQVSIVIADELENVIYSSSSAYTFNQSLKNSALLRNMSGSRESFFYQENAGSGKYLAVAVRG